MEKKGNDILNVYSDGASRGNPGSSGAGGVIKDNQGIVLDEICEYLGQLTNNQAEYKAMLICLERAIAYDPKIIIIFTDSELLANQINGRYKVKNPSLKVLYRRVLDRLNSFPEYKVKYISREDNLRADNLANEAIDLFQKGEKEEYYLPDEQGQIDLFK